MQDPVALRFTEKGIQELKSQSGLDVLGDGTYHTPTPKIMADAVYFKLKDAYGEFKPEAVADYLVKQWGPENRGPGQKEETTFFINVTDPSTGQETYVMNVAAWKNNLDVMPSLTIPYSVLKDATSTGVNVQAPAAAESGKTLATPEPAGTGALEATPAPEAAAQTPAEREKSAKRLLAVFGGLFATGVSMLGLGWLFGRGRGGEAVPSPLAQARGQRQKGGISQESLKALEGDRQRARDMAKKIKRGGNL